MTCAQATTYLRSPLQEKLGVSVYPASHVKPKWILSSGKLCGTANSVRNRQKRMDSWYPEIPNKSVYADDLIFKKRKITNRKNIYILKYLFAWYKICSWEQEEIVDGIPRSQLPSSGPSGKLLPALEVSLPIKLWTSDKISEVPFPLKFMGFCLT